MNWDDCAFCQSADEDEVTRFDLIRDHPYLKERNAVSYTGRHGALNAPQPQGQPGDAEPWPPYDPPYHAARKRRLSRRMILFLIASAVVVIVSVVVAITAFGSTAPNKADVAACRTVAAYSAGRATPGGAAAVLKSAAGEAQNAQFQKSAANLAAWFAAGGTVSTAAAYGDFKTIKAICTQDGVPGIS